jgi:uncharacterized protein (DUF58 family)
VSWAPTGKRRAYLALAALGAIAAVALRRPELAVLAVPFGALAALTPSSPPALDVRLAGVAPLRLLEGEHVEAGLELAVDGPVAWLEVVPAPGARFELAAAHVGTARAVGVPVRPPATVPVALELRASRWGANAVGGVVVRAHDRLGMAVAERRVEIPAVARVLPHGESLRELLVPAGTQPAPGDWPSRNRGGGTDLADIRPFVPGDAVRAINWRATARRGTPFVTERRAERTAEVVLFLDAFHDVGGTIERAVRAALAIAREHLARRDRVGIVGFGGAVWWLAPGIGRGQVLRVVDTLLQSQVIASAAWHDLGHVPRGALPARATVIALTPLFDERAIAALGDLVRRRFDVVIVEVEPDPAPAGTPADALADRLWTLERAELRARFMAAGAPCVRWPRGRPLDATVAEVNAWRRRPVRA